MNDVPDAMRARLDACWDARRDPLDDPQVCAWLAAHPLQLEHFAAWRAAMLALPEAVKAPGAVGEVRGRGLRRAAAAAAAVLIASTLVVGAALWLGAGSRGAGDPQRAGAVGGVVSAEDPVAAVSLARPRLSRGGRCVSHLQSTVVVGASSVFERRRETGAASARESTLLVSGSTGPAVSQPAGVVSAVRSLSYQEVVTP